jgi:hypothetical protein
MDGWRENFQSDDVAFMAGPEPPDDRVELSKAHQSDVVGMLGQRPDGACPRWGGNRRQRGGKDPATL